MNQEMEDFFIKRELLDRIHTVHKMYDSMVLGHAAGELYMSAIIQISKALNDLYQTVGEPPKKYRHTFVLPFEVYSEKSNYHTLTEEEIEAAFREQMKDVASMGFCEAATYESTEEDFE